MELLSLSQHSGHGKDKILLSAHSSLCAWHEASDTVHTSHLNSWEGLVKIFATTWPLFLILLLNSMIHRIPGCSPFPKSPAGSLRLTFSQTSPTAIFHQQITRTIRTCLISLTPVVFFLIYSKLSGVGIRAELWGGHTHCHLPPLPTGAGGWTANAHILMARAPPLRKNIHIYPNLDFH